MFTGRRIKTKVNDLHAEIFLQLYPTIKADGRLLRDLLQDVQLIKEFLNIELRQTPKHYAKKKTKKKAKG